MPETTKTIDPPKRPRAEIDAELAAAKARLHELHKAVEADRQRREMMEGYIEHCRKQWAGIWKDRTFDPAFFNPPALPHVPDLRLADEFHHQHYVVRDLEAEAALAGRYER